MKKRSGKNLIQWFYHFLVVLFMAMPLMSTLVRCLYVQFNHNAFESYSGVNGYSIDYKYESNEVNDLDDLQIGHIYEFDFKTNYVKPSSTGYTELGRFFAIYLLERSGSTVVQSYTVSSVGDFISLSYNNSNDNIYFALNNVSQQNIGGYSAFNNKIVVVFLRNSYSGYTADNYSYTDFNFIDGVDISNEGTLDNVFDYSIEKTYNEYKNTTLVDFTSFFNNVFIDYTDNLYMNFATWYIGWVLSCAIVSFVPYVLLSFYHLAIHVIDKFSRKGENL